LRQRRLAGALVLAVVAGWVILDSLENQFSYTTQTDLCRKAMSRLGDTCDPQARMILENCTKRISSISRGIWVEGLCGTAMLGMTIALFFRRSKRPMRADNDD